MPFAPRTNPNAGPTRRSARPGPRRVRGWVHGVVDSLDPDQGLIAVRVTGGSRAGRRMLGETVEFDAAGAELVLPDADGDRSSSLRDVFPGNEIEVRFSAADDGGLEARRIRHRGPHMPVGGLRRLWR